MQVLFVQVYVGGLVDPFYSETIGSITATLEKNNIKVDLFCFTAWWKVDALKRRIALYKPQVIAFSSLEFNFEAVKKLAAILKKEFPQITVVCGGIHITLNPEDFYQAQAIDAICIGDGEYAFLEFLRKLEKKQAYHLVEGFWYRKGNKIFKNPAREQIKDINKLPFSNRKIFLNSGYIYKKEQYNIKGYFSLIDPQENIAGFLFSRGCPFDCTYCCNHALKNFYGPEHYVRSKSPTRAIREIKYVLDKYNPDFLEFYDDTFTLNKKWLYEFLDKYKKFKIPFSCNIRVGTCSKETFLRLKEAGCRYVLIGLESGDDNLRKNIMNRIMTNKQIATTFKLAKEVGLKTFAYVMIGFPEEGPKEFINTLNLIKDTDSDVCWLSVFKPHKGTKLYDLCKKRKMLKKKAKKGFIERQDSVLDIPTFSREDILYYFHNFYFLVELNKGNGNFLKRIHKKILFFLLSKPPSYKLFPFYQFMVAFDRSLRIFFKIILNIKNKSFYYNYE